MVISFIIWTTAWSILGTAQVYESSYTREKCQHQDLAKPSFVPNQGFYRPLLAPLLPCMPARSNSSLGTHAQHCNSPAAYISSRLMSAVPGANIPIHSTARAEVLDKTIRVSLQGSFNFPTVFLSLEPPVDHPSSTHWPSLQISVPFLRFCLLLSHSR